MTAYFADFPSILYTFDPDQAEFYTLTDIFIRVDVIQSVLQNSLASYKYAMKDSDTLEGIAYKYYGDANRHWIIIFANLIIDPYFDIPLKVDDFNRNIIVKYGSIANAQSTLDHIQQIETITTIQNGSSNTMTYNSTVDLNGLTYDFRRNQIVSRTLPTLGNPIITVNQSQVTTPDGSQVSTVTTLNAVSCYDNEVAINEAKREIVLIDANYVSQIEAQYTALLAG